MTKYEHIFFDLDHTLWDFHSNSVETIEELFIVFDLAAKSKVSSSQYFVDRFVYHNDRLWDLYRRNRMNKSRLRKARFEAALRDIGLEDKKLAKQMGLAYLERCPRKTKLNGDALEVVAALHKHYTLHILSNGFHETQLIKLSCSGLADYFDHVITSEKANSRKPNARMFEYAERVTGASKEVSLMIGDNVEIDIKGAHAFGWDVIHYNEEGVEHTFPSIRKLKELPDLLLA